MAGRTENVYADLKMKKALTFELRVLLIMLCSCWALAGLFMSFQYHREKQYKAGMMDARLQTHNARILDDMRQGENIADVVDRIEPPVEELRVSLIDSSGHVVYDNTVANVAGDHNSRPEIRQARQNGEGHAIARVSLSDDRNYFYSARKGDNGQVIRSAAPYTHDLIAFLSADSTMLWVILAMTLAVTACALVATRRISVSISRLDRFAAAAEKGDPIYGEYSFPHDELGSIASHIVRLYVQRDEQHRQALALEKDRTRIKKQLTDNINHELKTPVASIQLSIDLLDDHPELSEDKKSDIMARIRANTERLGALLRDVSTLSLMEDAPARIDKAPVDLSALVDELAGEARMRTDMVVTVEMPRLTVDGNRQLLESIFRNLFDNAIAYSGGTAICVKADKDGNFEFSDNGVGVDEAHLPHLFERFYRVDTARSRQSGGTGLGLAIVRHAVSVHGGSITAISDSGLHLRFNLPVTR